MTRIYYDTEFLDDGRTIEFISIGMVTENGNTYYAVNGNMPWNWIWRHDWLHKNVVPYLPTKEFKSGDIGLDHDHPDVKNSAAIRDEVRSFVLNQTNPELWAWYGAYDHVVLCQLFGPMIRLPSTFPRYTNDLRQELNRFNKLQLPEQTVKLHHALSDAYWVKESHEYLMAVQYESG